MVEFKLVGNPSHTEYQVVDDSAVRRQPVASQLAGRKAVEITCQRAAHALTSMLEKAQSSTVKPSWVAMLAPVLHALQPPDVGKYAP